jgi:aminopeptidase-like protein
MSCRVTADWNGVRSPPERRCSTGRRPRERNIRAARITRPDGQAIVDFAECNLHVVSDSAPFNATLSPHELKRHIHTLPEQPGLIAYRTSYYTETWGF